MNYAWIENCDRGARGYRIESMPATAALILRQRVAIALEVARQRRDALAERIGFTRYCPTHTTPWERCRHDSCRGQARVERLARLLDVLRLRQLRAQEERRARGPAIGW